MIPDFRNFEGEGMRQLMHSAKGTTWTKKNAKYTDKVKTKNGKWRYIYGGNGGGAAKTIGKSAISSTKKTIANIGINKGFESLNKKAENNYNDKQSAIKKLSKSDIRTLFSGSNGNVNIKLDNGSTYNLTLKDYLSDFKTKVNAGIKSPAKVNKVGDSYVISFDGFSVPISADNSRPTRYTESNGEFGGKTTGYGIVIPNTTYSIPVADDSGFSDFVSATNKRK